MSNNLEIRRFSAFSIVLSENKSVVIFKISVDNDREIENFGKKLKEEFNQNFLNQEGVYFLKLKDGYYIGESNNLSHRLKEHIKNTEVTSITFATYKSPLHRLTKEKIRDLESILLDFAFQHHLTLGEKIKNKKNERRKTHNVFHVKENNDMGKFIWDNIVILNLDDILQDATSQLKEKEENLEISSSNKENKGIIKVDNTKIIETFNFKIFNHLIKRKIPTQGYRKRNIEIFNKTKSVQSLLLYLYDGYVGASVDTIITNGERTKGYLTAVTLSYYGIDTSGTNRGILTKLSREEAKKIIEELVSN